MSSEIHALAPVRPGGGPFFPPTIEIPLVRRILEYLNIRNLRQRLEVRRLILYRRKLYGWRPIHELEPAERFQRNAAHQGIRADEADTGGRQTVCIFLRFFIRSEQSNPHDLLVTGSSRVYLVVV